jgi:predicted nucleotidyltransferase
MFTRNRIFSFWTPSVEKDPEGRLFVNLERRYPAVRQYDDGTVRCPNGCSEGVHTHGVSDSMMSHRVSHCPAREKPEDDAGYMLLRPLPGLVGTELHWWEDAAQPEPKDGPSLLGEVLDLDADSLATEGK